MMSIASDQSCPKCGSCCFGKCYEEVNAVHVEGEGWYYAGSRTDGDRPNVLGGGVQCVGCGGVIVYDENGRTYRCGGHEEYHVLGEDFPGSDPCGVTYPIGRHVAYDVIF